MRRVAYSAKFKQVRNICSVVNVRLVSLTLRDVSTDFKCRGHVRVSCSLVSKRSIVAQKNVCTLETII